VEEPPSVEEPKEAATEAATEEDVASSDTTPADPRPPDAPEGPAEGPQDTVEEAPEEAKGTSGTGAPTQEAPVEEPVEDAPEAPPADDPPALAVDDTARIGMISDELRALMEQTTWEPGCPVEIDELRKLTLRYVDLDDDEHEGELIVHKDVAEDLLGVFVALYEDRFPIVRMEPIEHFDGDDDASMAANNTSAFNCRPITGSDRWSEHAYGWAVDINPIQNPYERDGEVLPPEGEPYLDRDDVRPGMVTRPGVVEYFDELGWGWGGDWNTLKDYMHLSLTGR
jgi:hypothetical protein